MSYADTIKRSWNEHRLMNALVELTYACNLDCDFCYNDLSLERETMLNLAQHKALLDDLASLSVLSLTLTGGEPLAHPHFFEIGTHARALGFVVRLKSNGHALRRHVAKRIVDEIDPFIIEVSFHGATAATHDRQTRVPGSFDRLMTNVKDMTALGLRVKANSVLTRWNESEIEAMFDLAETLGVPLQVDPEVKPRDDGDLSPLALSATEGGLSQYARSVARRATKDGTTLLENVAAARRESKDGTDKHCGAGSNNVAIDPFGNVLPCVQWRVPIGNLHHQRLTEIWRGSNRLDEIRETTRAARTMLDALGDPGLAANFCPGAAHTHHGDALALYPAAEQRIESARARVRLPVV
ncbi:MAG: radical SAM protein [Myxococcota bacterium]